MRKLLFIIVSTAIIATGLWCENINIYQVIPQDMIVDTDPIRYSVLNLIDDNPGTVYAIENKRINPKTPFLRFYFCDPISISGFKIKPGYFDPKYFNLNNRISEIRITRRYKGKIVGEREILKFTDEMVEQIVNLKKTYECSEIYIEIMGVFKGSKWDDTVVSDIKFLNGTIALTPLLTGSGRNVTGEYYHNIEYVNKNISHEHYQYGKSGDEDRYYLRNYNGRISVELNLEMDTENIINYFYKNPNDINPKEKVVYDQDGTIVQKVLFEYSGNKLTTENYLMGETYINKYFYNGDTISRIETNSKIAPDRNKILTYYYSNDKIIAEKKSVLGKEEETVIYQYIYKDGLLQNKVAILSYNYGINNEGFTVYPEPFFYKYKGQNLIEETSGSYIGDWEE